MVLREKIKFIFLFLLPLLFIITWIGKHESQLLSVRACATTTFGDYAQKPQRFFSNMASGECSAVCLAHTWLCSTVFDTSTTPQNFKIGV